MDVELKQNICLQLNLANLIILLRTLQQQNNFMTHKDNIIIRRNRELHRSCVRQGKRKRLFKPRLM